MSRKFNGQVVAESITFGTGNAPDNQGPITIAVLLKGDSAGAWAGQASLYVEGRNSTPDGVWGMLTDAGQPYLHGAFSSPTTLTADTWYWLVGTKPAGAVQARWHVWDLTGAWLHTAGGSNAQDGSNGPIVSIVVGDAADFGGRLRGWLAALAVWNSELTDGQVEAACTLAAGDLAGAVPAWGVLFPPDQVLTDAVLDFTGGGGNETGRTGTSVSNDDPAGFDYVIGPVTVNVDAPAGAADAEALWDEGLTVNLTLQAGQAINSAGTAYNATVQTEAGGTVTPVVAQPALASAVAFPAAPVATEQPSVGDGEVAGGTVDVGDAVELTFSTLTGATVFVTWYDPDGVVVVDEEFVPENLAGSGEHPYTFLPTRPGMWTAVFVASGAATATEAYYVRAHPVPGPAPLATVDEFRELFRPMSTAEQTLAGKLLRYASQLLRGRFPDLDARIGRGALDSDVAGLAAINMVLRVMRNPAGLPPLASERVGPFSRSYFADGAAGLLVLTAAEEAMVTPPAAGATAIGTVMARPGLAAWPVGVRRDRELRRWW